MKKAKIPRRGRFSTPFLNNETVKKILKIVKENRELDAQLRDGYINVYVDGGNVLRISKSRGNSVATFLDKYYFYDNPKVPKTYVEEVLKGKPREDPPSSYPSYHEAVELMKEPTQKHSALMELIANGKEDEYFNEAIPLVKDWVKRKKRFERRNQHIIACSNRDFSEENNLVVIDIEFAVSTNKPYNISNKVPKMDIIAVDRLGQVYCIELKDNLYADRDNSAQNIDAHKRDFDLTIGNPVQENDFVLEMKEVVDTKKALGLLPESIEVNTSLTPVFAIAYSGKIKKDIEEFRTKHAQNYNIIEVNPITDNDIKLNIV